jgi:N-methylhydantoinase A
VTIRIGVDIGGTFTDAVLIDTDASLILVAKSLTTPDDRTAGVSAAVEGVLAKAGRKSGEVDVFAHGSTVGLNALLERKGASTALLATKGFTDTIEIGRQTRDALYDLSVQRQEPLVRRHLRKGIEERIGAGGNVILPLDEKAMEEAISELDAGEVESVAICLLHSYANPVHERKVSAAVARLLPDAYVAVSSEVLPEFREYERMSTTALTAYLGPVLRAYLSQLEEAMRAIGLQPKPRIMQSNMGFASAAQVIRSPAKNVLSGPCAGVAGAVYMTTASGFENIITLDMGGTSADVCLISGGQPLFTTSGEIAGVPIRHSMVDAVEIGAGGGSIAWLDETNRLKVGPASAGAAPGPICYGLGGTEVTVTDAHAVLGHVGGQSLFAERELNIEKARTLLREKVADPLGLSAEDAAGSIIRLASNNMERGIRQVSVERGIDPRDYALVAFGGAGPMHACELAADLRIPRVVIPPHPGVLSALGLLTVDCRADFVRTHMLSMSAPRIREEIDQTVQDLTIEAVAWLRDAEIETESKRTVASLDLRYIHQNYEINVGIGPGESPEQILSKFHAAHEKRYGYSAPGKLVQLVNIRLSVIGSVPRPPLGSRLGDPIDPSGSPEPRGHRPVSLFGTWEDDCPIYIREMLRSGDRLAGPAIVEEQGATTVVPPGFSCDVDAIGSLVIATEDVQ